jgi:hypothetical protein
MKTFCPYCENTHLYILGDGRLECSTCKARYSPKKIQRNLILLDAFIHQITPKDVAQTTNISLPTIHSYYGQFRSLLPKFMDYIYQKDSATYREYEEYLFLPNSKRGKQEFLIQGIGIIGLYGKGGVYTLLMPNHWKNMDKSVKNNPDFAATLAHYYQWDKLIRIESRDTPIGKFWIFLEDFLRSFHGVKEEFFGLYLKEAEFRFNFSKEEQAHHLMRLWKKDLKQKL